MRHHLTQASLTSLFILEDQPGLAPTAAPGLRVEAEEWAELQNEALAAVGPPRWGHA